MAKKILIPSMVFLLAISLANLSFAQEAKTEQEKSEVVIKGTVKEIAADASYVVVDDTNISTTKDFLENSFLEVGDKVEITAQKDEQGLKAISYRYVFEDETQTPNETEENPPSGATPADEPPMGLPEDY